MPLGLPSPLGLMATCVSSYPMGAGHKMGISLHGQAVLQSQCHHSRLSSAERAGAAAMDWNSGRLGRWAAGPLQPGGRGQAGGGPSLSE